MNNLLTGLESVKLPEVKVAITLDTDTLVNLYLWGMLLGASLMLVLLLFNSAKSKQ